MSTISAVVIPTMPGREEYLGQLLWQLSTVPWVSRVEVSQHTERFDDWCRAMSLGFEASAGDDWFMWMEDDVYLGPRFREVPGLIERAVGKYGNGLGMLSFYDSDATGIAADGDGYTDTNLAKTWMAQAVALARWAVPNDVRRFMELESKNRKPENRSGFHFDLMHGRMVRKAGGCAARYAPSLVQHRAGLSARLKRVWVSQSESYRAAFGEIPGEG